MKRLILVCFVLSIFIVPSIASAQTPTIAELMAMIEELKAQISVLQGQSSTSTPINIPSCFTFTKDLGVGDSGEEVTALQNFLALKGYLTTSATGYFGSLTKTALAAYQSANGITATGFFDPVTRAKVDFSYGCKTPICPSILINGSTYSLDPCSVTLSMVDGQGDKTFTSKIVGSGLYGFSVHGYGEGFPTYGIMSSPSSGGAFGNTSLNFTLNDNYLSSNGGSSKTYSGYMPIHIFQGSETGNDNNYLNLKVNLTVLPKDQPATSTTPTITVLSPNGGEIWVQGTTYPINWTTSNFGKLNVSLDLVNSNGYIVKNIINNVSDTGTYWWNPDSTITPGNYKIMASSFDKGPSADD
ncbi:peptidoglycan-binding protein [Candidatus Nomurabacteria bacterium]|nr:peptidoglycan-binding protein [Candidatus Nomurabacteria bacterium]